MRRAHLKFMIPCLLSGALSCQLSGICTTHEREAKIYFHQANALATAGKTKQAARAYRKSLDLNPTDAAVWARYAGIFETELKPAQAIEALSRAIEYQHGRNPFELGRRAEQYVAVGRWQDAVNDYTEAIKHSKGDDLAGFYLERGDLLATKQLFDRAIADYTQDIRIESDPTRGYERRAAAYKQLHLSEKALSDIHAALKLEHDRDDLATLHKMCADIYLEQNKHDLALSELNKAIETEPHRTSYMEQRAKIYDHAGRHDLAQQERSRLKQMDKDYFGE